MIVVCLSHPYGGDPLNRAAAKSWMVWLADHGYAPVATWITLTELWGEDRRDDGLEIDRELIARCDVMLLCGDRISDGMMRECEFASEFGVPVVDVTGTSIDEYDPEIAVEVMISINKAVRA